MSQICNDTDKSAVVSFIIPAYNEKDCIGNCIQAIKDHHPNYNYQIIVVNNGSTDCTGEIVEAAGAILIQNTKGTISSARNIGVLSSDGAVLVFLDADVLVTSFWKREIDDIISTLMKNPPLVTGSRYCCSDESKWLLRFWFSRMKDEKANYINGGHLIVAREVFNYIGGFTEELFTAEDYDFCMKAKRMGVEILNDPDLRVIHTGYPTTIKNFINREKWHGSEDFRSFSKILKSKVALIAIANVFLMFSFLVFAVLDRNVVYILLYFVLMFGLSFISTLIKFEYGNIYSVINTSLIFYFYYLGRSCAFVDRIKGLFRLKLKKY